MKLLPRLVEKPWGRTDLPASFSGAAGQRIGEVWFEAPHANLPLLVKWLFTSAPLSIQVHPDDRQGRASGFVSGKEECWVVTAAEPGAVLGIGTTQPLDAGQLRAAALSGAIEQLMDWKPVRAGDYFYIPAGTVHAIGAGVTLVEVQQHADVTYRLYDYGRPRELQLDAAIAVSRAAPYHDPRCGRLTAAPRQQLVSGPLFTLWHARGSAIVEPGAEGPECSRPDRWIVPLSGAVSTGDLEAHTGDCLHVPATAAITADADASALIAWAGPGVDAA
ncbi:MAG: class I mannose-6-phosphate isomerase [Novosphingobium sp.]|nr:class I mannose-6-phosphate isomerase [Novosphingobium sp.]